VKSWIASKVCDVVLEYRIFGHENRKTRRNS
jgi:hypothetical protein